MKPDPQSDNWFAIVLTYQMYNCAFKVFRYRPHIAWHFPYSGVNKFSLNRVVNVYEMLKQLEIYEQWTIKNTSHTLNCNIDWTN